MGRLPGWMRWIHRSRIVLVPMKLPRRPLTAGRSDRLLLILVPQLCVPGSLPREECVATASFQTDWGPLVAARSTQGLLAFVPQQRLPLLLRRLLLSAAAASWPVLGAACLAATRAPLEVMLRRKAAKATCCEGVVRLEASNATCHLLLPKGTPVAVPAAPAGP